MSTPMISVIMSCYNASKTLDRAVDSILQQTHTDFEFIIIEDGSSDSTIEDLKTWADKDGRIKIIQNKKNLGLAFSLNKGILIARGKYIARMDADDRAHRDRFTKQVRFLETHQHVQVLGTGVVQVNNQQDKIKTVFLPELHQDIVKRVFKKTMLFHPTIMVRKEIFTTCGFYNEKLRWAEDADLWYRIYDQVIFHNLQEALLDYTLKERFKIRHAKGNLSVKVSHLKSRGLLLRHLPFIALDMISYTHKLIVK